MRHKPYHENSLNLINLSERTRVLEESIQMGCRMVGKMRELATQLQNDLSVNLKRYGDDGE